MDGGGQPVETASARAPALKPAADWRWRLILRLDLLALGVLTLVLATSLWAIANLRAYQWVDLLWDDAYYYLGVARGIVERGQSSFLPPFETNGYQPLWLALITLTGFVFGTSTTALVAETYILCAAFTLAFAFVSRRAYGAAFPAIAVTLVFPVVMTVGMETTMIPALFILFMQAKGWRARGTLGTLLALARLDAACVILMRDLYTFATTRKVDLRHYMILVPAAAAYALFNQVMFGSPVPVSGLAKAIGAAPGENLSTMIRLYAIGFQGTGLLLACALVAGALAKRRILPTYRREIVVAMASLACCVGYYGVASGWPIWPWYRWPILMINFYLLQELVAAAKAIDFGAIRRNWRSLGALAAAAATVAVAWGVGDSSYAAWRYADWRSRIVEGNTNYRFPAASFGQRNLVLVDWLKHRGVEPGAFFAMGDRAGSFGFFMGQDYRFIHTEGLVGPAAYVHAMKEGRAREFVDALPIDYWIADRGRYMEEGDIIGVMEPVQGLSSRVGPYLVCFTRGSILMSERYRQGDWQQRLLIDATGRTPCPAAMEQRFERMRARYGAAANFSLTTGAPLRTEPLPSPTADATPGR
jgi:hypothetical protein